MQILVRFAGEMVIKSQQVRHRFQKQLVRNMREAFKSAGLPLQVHKEWSRIFLTTSEGEEPLLLLRRIFGISSFSVIEATCASDMDTILSTGTELYAKTIAGKTFAVRARRTGEQPFTSMDVERKLGAILRAESGASVNLSKPERPIFVEVRPDATYFYCESIRGAGGLPLATAGRALCLMSGGFDSAVAAWMLQKRGVEVHYLLCNLAGEAYERSVLRVAKQLSDLWSHGYAPKFHVLDFQEVSAELRNKVTPRFVQVILKRLFYKAAEAVALRYNTDALVTGEAIAQVSTQTLANLKAIDEASSLPVMRPLIAYDKGDIVRLSQTIGTHDFSASIQEFCQLVPDKPATACKLETALLEEQKVDPAVLERALAKLKTFSIKKLGLNDLTTPYIFRNDIPDGAVVIDCRSGSDFAKSHFTGAIHREFFDLLAHFKDLDKKTNYVLYCEAGLQSAVAAEKMQSAGYLAYSLQGGLANLALSPTVHHAST